MVLLRTATDRDLNAESLNQAPISPKRVYGNTPGTTESFHMAPTVQGLHLNRDSSQRWGLRGGRGAWARREVRATDSLAGINDEAETRGDEGETRGDGSLSRLPAKVWSRKEAAVAEVAGPT